MQKLADGIYRVCDAIQPIILALLILMLIIAGIERIIGGAEGHAKFKEVIKGLLIGSAVAFGATAIGTEISSWFIG